MQTVIAEQYIAKRRKPVRIIQDLSLVHAPANGRITPPTFRELCERSLQERSPRPGSIGVDAFIYKPADRQEPARADSRHVHGTVHGDARVHVRSGGARPGPLQLIRARFTRRHATPGEVRKPRDMDRFWSALSGLGSMRAMLAMIALMATAGLTAGAAVLAASSRAPDLSAFSLAPEDSANALLLDLLGPENALADDELVAPALPLTVTLSEYRVVKNDTLEGIARRHGLRLDTLISVNGLSDARRIYAGKTLKIPSIDGVAHTVRRGDSLSRIAADRGVAMIDIIDANDLDDQTIVPGQSLFIPGARLSSYDLKKALGKLVIWPIKGSISSYFGYRPNPFTGIRQFHNGIDIVGPLNLPVKASMDGRVAETGYSSVFGNFVILTHPEGYQTLYAHLNKISVKQGASVAQGGAVGLLGSTGYSTGPHVHFGVFKNGKAVDPLKLIK